MKRLLLIALTVATTISPAYSETIPVGWVETPIQATPIRFNEQAAPAPAPAQMEIITKIDKTGSVAVQGAPNPVLFNQLKAEYIKLHPEFKKTWKQRLLVGDPQFWRWMKTRGLTIFQILCGLASIGIQLAH